MFESDQESLHWHFDGEHLQIQPWGESAFRVRSTKIAVMPELPWALSETVNPQEPQISIPAVQQTLNPPDKELHGSHKHFEGASITNGSIKATLTAYGKLCISNTKSSKQVFEEYSRTKIDFNDPKTSAIEVRSREFRPHGTGASEYHLHYRIESQDPEERIYGMGQYQQPLLNLKGFDLELAQRNSQASVPFFVSSLNYGFLWNNPSVGRAVFGRNVMTFEAASTNALDFWIVVGDSPREIMSRYADATGHAPVMPEYGLGFWQSKLRYINQEELMSTAREYKKRDLPLDVIVADYFHWPFQGDWRWDLSAWPDPQQMVQELEEMGIKLVVSVWPTVDKRSENYSETMEKGLLIRVDRGIHTTRDFMGQNVQADFTNPRTREYVWEKLRQNYHDVGVKCFWLDEAEPEFNSYAFENYRYYLGPALSVANVYPVAYAQAIFDGQLAAGQTCGGTNGIMNLVRCAWAGSQKYGALIWSGDTASSWNALRNQLPAGLNMGMSGIPWWTTDIGGFYGGVTTDPAFRELLIRWFQFGTFCPVMRLHGCREPTRVPSASEGGLSLCPTGAANEIWSFGEDVYSALRKYLKLRYRLRDYIRKLMEEASVHGSPVMRTLFFEFPDDPKCWQVENQYMFGDRYLCAPVLQSGIETQSVYLPQGARWSRFVIGEEGDTAEGEFEGGQTVVVSTPIDVMPVFCHCQRRKKRCNHEIQSTPQGPQEEAGRNDAPTQSNTTPVRVGDYHPESILADLSSPEDGHRQVQRLDRDDEQTSQNRCFRINRAASDSLIKKRQAEWWHHQRRRPELEPLSEYHRMHLEKSGAFLILPKSTTHALIAAYISALDDLIPIVDGPQVLLDFSRGCASTFLIRAICLVICKTEQARPFLRLKDGDTVMEPYLFAKTLFDGLTAAIGADLERDRVTKIQILALMHLHNDGQAGVERASAHLSQAIHEAYTSSLHFDVPGNPLQEQCHMLWWNLHCFDRLNKFMQGMPFMIPNSEIQTGRPVAGSSYRSQVLAISVELGDLMQKLHPVYNPTVPQDIDALETFPLFSDITKDARIHEFQASHRDYLEIWYHVAAMLSCRSSPPGSAPYERRLKSADRIQEIMSHGRHTYLPPMPLIPYAISMSLTVIYRALKEKQCDPSQGRKSVAARIEILDALSPLWTTAQEMAKQAKGVLGVLYQNATRVPTRAPTPDTNRVGNFNSTHDPPPSAIPRSTSKGNSPQDTEVTICYDSIATPITQRQSDHPPFTPNEESPSGNEHDTPTLENLLDFIYPENWVSSSFAHSSIGMLNMLSGPIAWNAVPGLGDDVGSFTGYMEGYGGDRSYGGAGEEP